MPNWSTVERLLAANDYCVLATAADDGTPWATPVYFARHGEHDLVWVSSAASRHSRNIAVRPTVAITVFDSTVAVGAAEALYLTATAGEVDDARDALAALNRRLPPGHTLEAGDLAPRGPLTAYRATVHRWEVLVRGSDASHDGGVDGRVEVQR